MQMSKTGAIDDVPKMQIFFENTMDALQKVIQETDSFMETQAVSPALTYAVRLALEELATNIIKYGYDDRKPHQIELSLVLSTPAVMTLTDDGHSFNPLDDAPAPTLDGPIEDRPIGGLGLHMIQAMGMQLDYQWKNGRNVLAVVFPGA